LKQTINVGAYGWLHPHWENNFYPEDLPADWRLGYYSNEFNTVLVPAFYWHQQHLADCEALLDDVHPEFRFFIEYDERIFDTLSREKFTESLALLTPQLSGLVFLGGLQQRKYPDAGFYALGDTLGIDMIGDQSAGDKPGSASEKIWQPEMLAMIDQQPARFAMIEDDLCDLRAVRSRIEPFTSQLQEDGPAEDVATMIINHPQLQPADMGRLRSALQIMGH
jgi:Protein of unknown function DUF72